MNARAPASPSLQSTPTSRPRPALLREKRSSAGASREQGPHQLAQKTTSAGPPALSESRLESVAGGPARRSRGSAGARAPPVEEPCGASPNAISATSAAPAAIQPRARRRRAIAKRSVGGQNGHVVGYFRWLETRGVDRYPLARAGDSVDEARVVDELGLLGVLFGAHPPRLPHPGELRSGADQVLHAAGHLMSSQKGGDGLGRVPPRVHRDGDDLRFGGHRRAHQVL